MSKDGNESNDPGAAESTDAESADADRDLEDLLASYVDRVTAGEKMHREEILAQHPEHADEILEHLANLCEIDEERQAPAPLGKLGDYTLSGQVGRGGMGVVYDAWQISMDRRVALKVLPAGVAADDKSFQRFMREARAAGKLNHPNVVAVHAMGQDDNTAYYAMLTGQSPRTFPRS